MKSWDSEMGAIRRWAVGLSPGERSRLRRCADQNAVLCQPAFGRLLAELRDGDADFNPALATVAGVVAHVHDSAGRLADALAGTLSERRFARLLACGQHDAEMFRHWRRAVVLLRGSAPLDELIRTVYFWNESTRSQLSVNFYRSKQS